MSAQTHIGDVLDSLRHSAQTMGQLNVLFRLIADRMAGDPTGKALAEIGAYLACDGEGYAESVASQAEHGGVRHD